MWVSSRCIFSLYQIHRAWFAAFMPAGQWTVSLTSQIFFHQSSMGCDFWIWYRKCKLWWKQRELNTIILSDRAKCVLFLLDKLWKRWAEETKTLIGKGATQLYCRRNISLIVEVTYLNINWCLIIIMSFTEWTNLSRNQWGRYVNTKDATVQWMKV